MWPNWDANRVHKRWAVIVGKHTPCGRSGTGFNNETTCCFSNMMTTLQPASYYHRQVRRASSRKNKNNWVTWDRIRWKTQPEKGFGRLIYDKTCDKQRMPTNKSRPPERPPEHHYSLSPGIPTRFMDRVIQIQSFLLGYGAVKTTKNDQGVVWVYGKGHLGVSFCVGRCVLREWVVVGGGLDGYFGEQGLRVGIQECLERFHRRCVDYLSRQFVPKWESPNGGRELTTAGKTSLLVKLVGVSA